MSDTSKKVKFTGGRVKSDKPLTKPMTYQATVKSFNEVMRARHTPFLSVVDPSEPLLGPIAAASRTMSASFTHVVTKAGMEAKKVSQNSTSKHSSKDVESSVEDAAEGGTHNTQSPAAGYDKPVNDFTLDQELVTMMVDHSLSPRRLQSKQKLSTQSQDVLTAIPPPPPFTLPDIALSASQQLRLARMYEEKVRASTAVHLVKEQVKRRPQLLHRLQREHWRATTDVRWRDELAHSEYVRHRLLLEEWERKVVEEERAATMQGIAMYLHQPPSHATPTAASSSTASGAPTLPPLSRPASGSTSCTISRSTTVSSGARTHALSRTSSARGEPSRPVSAATDTEHGGAGDVSHANTRSGLDASRPSSSTATTPRPPTTQRPANTPTRQLSRSSNRPFEETHRGLGATGRPLSRALATDPEALTASLLTPQTQSSFNYSQFSATNRLTNTKTVMLAHGRKHTGSDASPRSPPQLDCTTTYPVTHAPQVAGSAGHDSARGRAREPLPLFHTTLLYAQGADKAKMEKSRGEEARGNSKGAGATQRGKSKTHQHTHTRTAALPAPASTSVTSAAGHDASSDSSFVSSFDALTLAQQLKSGMYSISGEQLPPLQGTTHEKDAERAVRYNAGNAGPGTGMGDEEGGALVEAGGDGAVATRDTKHDVSSGVSGKSPRKNTFASTRTYSESYILHTTRKWLPETLPPNHPSSMLWAPKYATVSPYEGRYTIDTRPVYREGRTGVRGYTGARAGRIRERKVEGRKEELSAAQRECVGEEEEEGEEGKEGEEDEEDYAERYADENAGREEEEDSSRDEEAEAEDGEGTAGSGEAEEEKEQEEEEETTPTKKYASEEGIVALDGRDTGAGTAPAVDEEAAHEDEAVSPAIEAETAHSDDGDVAAPEDNDPPAIAHATGPVDTGAVTVPPGEAEADAEDAVADVAESEEWAPTSDTGNDIVAAAAVAPEDAGADASDDDLTLGTTEDATEHAAEVDFITPSAAGGGGDPAVEGSDEADALRSGVDDNLMLGSGPEEVVVAAEAPTSPPKEAAVTLSLDDGDDLTLGATADGDLTLGIDEDLTLGTEDGGAETAIILTPETTNTPTAAAAVANAEPEALASDDLTMGDDGSEPVVAITATATHDTAAPAVANASATNPDNDVDLDIEDDDDVDTGAAAALLDESAKPSGEVDAKEVDSGAAAGVDDDLTLGNEEGDDLTLRSGGDADLTLGTGDDDLTLGDAEASLALSADDDGVDIQDAASPPTTAVPTVAEAADASPSTVAAHSASTNASAGAAPAGDAADTADDPDIGDIDDMGDLDDEAAAEKPSAAVNTIPAVAATGDDEALLSLDDTAQEEATSAPTPVTITPAEPEKPPVLTSTLSDNLEDSNDDLTLGETMATDLALSADDDALTLEDGDDL